MSSREDAFGEAVREIHIHAINVGIEHGDYAAKLVIDTANVVAALADDNPPTTNGYDRVNLLDDIDGSQYLRLVTYLQDHPAISVRHALNRWLAGDR